MTYFAMHKEIDKFVKELYGQSCAGILVKGFNGFHDSYKALIMLCNGVLYLLKYSEVGEVAQLPYVVFLKCKILYIRLLVIMLICTTCLLGIEVMIF